jgi:predicted RNase H-like HicB family nuclease
MNPTYYQITAIIEKDEFGYYAYCPQLQGCQTQGDSLAEIQSNIQEAIELYLSTLSEEEKRLLLQKEISMINLGVQVA